MRKILVVLLSVFAVAGIATAVYTKKASIGDVIDSLPSK